MLRLLTITIVLSFASALSAAELVVPTQYATIQAAVDAASPGDTVQVNGGITPYQEDVTINKRITLRSATHSAPWAYLYGKITVAASGESKTKPLRISGFNLRGSDVGIEFSGVCENVELYRNAIRNEDLDPDDGGCAILIDNADVRGLSIVHTTISNYRAGLEVTANGKLNDLLMIGGHFQACMYGCDFHADPSISNNETRIDNLLFQDVKWLSTLFNGIRASAVNNLRLDGCTVTLNANYNAHWSNLSTQADTYSGPIWLDLQRGDYSNIRIENSTLLHAPHYPLNDKSAGVMVTARQDGPLFATNPATLNGLTISGTTLRSYRADIRLGRSDAITSGLSAVRIQRCNFGEGGSGPAIYSAMQGGIDARDNYWGDPSGSSNNGGLGLGTVQVGGGSVPDTSNHLLAKVDDITIRVNQAWSTVSAGQDPDGNGPAKAMGVDAFATIQEAIANAGRGDAIILANGVYPVNSLEITQDNLRIYGESQAGVEIVPSAVDSKDPSIAGGTPVYGFVLRGRGIALYTMTFNGEGNNANLGEASGANNFRAAIFGPQDQMLMGFLGTEITVKGCVHSGVYYRTAVQDFGRYSSVGFSKSTFSDITYANGIAVSGGVGVTESAFDGIGTSPIGQNYVGTCIRYDGGLIPIQGNTFRDFSMSAIRGVDNPYTHPTRVSIWSNTVTDFIYTPPANGSTAIFWVEDIGDGSHIGSVPYDGNLIDIPSPGSGSYWPVVGIKVSRTAKASPIWHNAISKNIIRIGGEGAGIVIEGGGSSEEPLEVSFNQIEHLRVGNTSQVQGNSAAIVLNDGRDQYRLSDPQRPFPLNVQFFGNRLSKFYTGLSIEQWFEEEVKVEVSATNSFEDHSWAMRIHDDGMVNSSTTEVSRAEVEFGLGSLRFVGVANGIDVAGARLSIDRTAFDGISSTALRLRDGAHLESFTHNRLEGMQTGISAQGGVTFGAFSNNEFSNISIFGVVATPPQFVLAENNYWGDPSGPTHNSNASGTGVAVSGNVDVHPFETTAPVRTEFLSTPPASVVFGQTYSYPILTSGNNVMLSVSGLPYWLSYDENTKTISGFAGTPSLSNFHFITILAQGDSGPVVVQQFEVEVIHEAPKITSTPPNGSINAGDFYSYTIVTTGTPQPVISVSGLPNWLTFNSVDTISGRPGAGDGGQYNISVWVRNGVLPDAYQQFTLDVHTQSPVITSTLPSTTILATTPFTYKVVATGNPAPSISVMNLPSWLSFDNVDTISGTPGMNDTGTTPTISVIASNGVGTDAVQDFTIDVLGTAPHITSSVPATVIDAGDFFSYTISVLGSPIPTISVSNMPAWMNFDNAATISGTPSIGDIGVSPVITISADNGVGLPDTQVFTLTVEGRAPGFSSNPAYQAVVGKPYVYQFVAFGTPDPNVSVTGLPTWLSFDGNDRITGTPPIGSHGKTGFIEITISNGIGLPQTQSYRIDVHDPSVPPAGGGGGCAIGSSNGRLPFGVFLSVLSLLALWLRRRKVRVLHRL